VVLLILVTALLLVLMYISILPCSRVLDLTQLIIKDMGLLLEWLLLGDWLLGMLLLGLLVLLVDLLLLMEGRRSEPLRCREPVSPRIDRGRHPGPGHGSRDAESGDGRAGLLLHGWSGVRLLADVMLLDIGVGCRDGDRGLRLCSD
jgi:hypothetical protein